MKNSGIWGVCCTVVLLCAIQVSCWAQQPADSGAAMPDNDTDVEAVQNSNATPGALAPDRDVSEEHSTAHIILLYLPNRVLDLLDIFRARVRVGPGFAASVRVTEAASAHVGAYGSVYAGLPGPRQRRMPKLPVGVETLAGVGVSVINADASGGLGPEYSPSEVEAGVHLGIIGLDLGLDPLEIADFAAGIFGVDFREDDL